MKWGRKTHGDQEGEMPQHMTPEMMAQMNLAQQLGDPGRVDEATTIAHSTIGKATVQMSLADYTRLADSLGFLNDARRFETGKLRSELALKDQQISGFDAERNSLMNPRARTNWYRLRSKLFWIVVVVILIGIVLHSKSETARRAMDSWMNKAGQAISASNAGSGQSDMIASTPSPTTFAVEAQRYRYRNVTMDADPNTMIRFDLLNGAAISQAYVYEFDAATNVPTRVGRCDSNEEASCNGSSSFRPRSMNSITEADPEFALFTRLLTAAFQAGGIKPATSTAPTSISAPSTSGGDNAVRPPPPLTPTETR